MLTAHNISKSYNLKPVLDGITFNLNPGELVGLIGPNGCGKTTLLKILAGLEQPDSGHVAFNPQDLRIGYLAQSFAAKPGISLGSLIEQALGSPRALENDLLRLANELTRQPNNTQIQIAYDDTLRRIEELDQARPARMEVILGALGLADVPRDRLVKKISGGQKTRLGLALVLIQNPQLVLLDEPTNHLDIGMLEWLEEWLVNFAGDPTSPSRQTALIVSHDRAFLDRTVNRILDIDPATRSLREYRGSYNDYHQQVVLEHERQMAAYRDQEYEIQRMKQDITRTKQQSLNVELTTTSRQPGIRRIAKKVAKKAQSRQKKLNRYLESSERVEKPKQGWQINLAFDEPQHLGQDVLSVQNLAIGYPGQPRLASGMTSSIRAGERIALTGPNGCGKTTFLRTVGGLLDPADGQVQLGSSVRIGYMAQEQELLDLQLSALATVQQLAPMGETEARSFLHFFLFSGDDALRPVNELSLGERARLMLANLVVQGCNFLLLDEPINHLDIPSRERFEQALANFDGAILAVVHDRYFIQRFANHVWEIKDGRLIQD